MGKRPRQAMPEKGHQPVVHFDLSQNSFVEFKRAEAPLETAQRAQRHRTTSTSSSCSSTEPLTGGTALMGGATAPLYSETHTGILKNKSFNEPTLTEEPVAHAELLATPLPIEEVTMELSTNSGNISSYSLSPSPSQQPSSVAVKKKHRKKKNRGVCRRVMQGVFNENSHVITDHHSA